MESLSPNNPVFRVGRTVRRPVLPWTPVIGDFLRHLEARGLPVEPFLGMEGDTMRTGFIDGEMVHPEKWTDEGLAAVGRLTAALHRAGADFHPGPAGGAPACAPWCLREIGREDRIWCHGDLAPWNLLTKDGLPLCLVDWEFAGPLDPLVELARICWLFPQLVDDDLRDKYGLPSPEKRAAQVRLICDAYGLEKARRARMTQQILEVILCETAHEAIDPGLTPASEGPLWGFAWRTRSLYWVWRHRSVLENALT